MSDSVARCGTVVMKSLEVFLHGFHSTEVIEVLEVLERGSRELHLNPIVSGHECVSIAARRNCSLHAMANFEFHTTEETSLSSPFV